MAVPVSTFNIYLFIIKYDLIRSIKGTQNKNMKTPNKKQNGNNNNNNKIN